MLNLDKLISYQDLEFERNRFWSSPKELPVRNIIGVVLNNPTLSDVHVLTDAFGLQTVRHAFEVMIKKEELSPTQIDFDTNYLNTIEQGNNHYQSAS